MNPTSKSEGAVEKHESFKDADKAYAVGVRSGLARAAYMLELAAVEAFKRNDDPTADLLRSIHNGLKELEKSIKD